MTHSQIYAALVAHLKTLSPLPPVAEENSDFEPNTNQMFIYAKHVPQISDAKTVKGSGHKYLQGLISLQVYAPRGSGLTGLDALSSALMSHFPVGLTIGDIKIRQVKEVGNIEAETWTYRPIDISYSVVTD